VYDDQGRQHGVVVLRNSAIDEHVVPDGMSHDHTTYTDAERELVETVQRRARYEAHWQTDFDLVEPNWDPNVIRSGIAVIESLSDEEFARYFEETYDRLVDPAVGAAPEDVEVILQAVYLDDLDRRIVDVSDVLIAVNRRGGAEWIGEGADTGRPADVDIELPQMEFDFPFGERFREFLVHHLKCQIRDIHFSIGEEPPEDCRLDGQGKMPVLEEIESMAAR